MGDAPALGGVVRIALEWFVLGTLVRLVRVHPLAHGIDLAGSQGQSPAFRCTVAAPGDGSRLAGTGGDKARLLRFRVECRVYVGTTFFSSCTFFFFLSPTFSSKPFTPLRSPIPRPGGLRSASPPGQARSYFSPRSAVQEDARRPVSRISFFRSGISDYQARLGSRSSPSV